MKSGEIYSRFSKWVFWAGLLLVAFGLILLVLIFFPTFRSEISYLFYQMPENVAVNSEGKWSVAPSDRKTVIAADSRFSLIIPKIGINSKVIADVNPFDEAEYRRALTKGVAHSRGTSVPGQKGNILIFAHSSDNFYNSNRYNTIFYLLRKLQANDDVWVVYEGILYRYQVKETRYVDENEIDYLKYQPEGNELILMTCWPPGTSFRRLLVVCTDASSAN